MADRLAGLGTVDREAVFLGGKLGFGRRHPRLAPAADVEPLIDRGRRFGAVETRIGARAGEILDFDVKDGIVPKPCLAQAPARRFDIGRSEEHTSELQTLMRISYAVFCLKKKIKKYIP